MKKLVIVIGPTRTGTSSAWTALRDFRLEFLSLSLSKENYFFHTDYNSERYCCCFDNQTDYIFDLAPSLFHRDGALANLARLEVKKSVYVVLRKPSELYRSSYQYNLQNSKHGMSFEEYLTDNVFDRFSYEKRLAKINELMPDTEIKFLLFSELTTNMPLVLSEIIRTEFDICLTGLSLAKTHHVNKSGVTYRFGAVLQIAKFIGKRIPGLKNFVLTKINWVRVREIFFEKNSVDPVDFSLSPHKVNRIAYEDEYFSTLASNYYSARE